MSDTDKTSPDRLTLILRWVVGLVLIGLLAAAGWLAYAYGATPIALRHPTQAHFHFRLQIINDGHPVNFAADSFQTPFNKDNCSAALTKEPIHFHDHLDQFVHIHWSGITGGLVLKNYGWNLVGGPTDNTLGYRFDQLPKLTRLPIHGQALPSPPSGVKYYVYSSSIAKPMEYEERSWDDFLSLSLVDFFGTSNTHSQSWLGRLIPPAEAHNGESHTGAVQATTSTEVDAAQLNHVLGNVVIFVQKDKPAEQQIKARFEHLIPLPESSCSG